MLCGIDEAGRGPLAGPVTAAAVVFTGSIAPALLADSKTLTAKQREEARRAIVESAVWALGWASPEEIDRINILQASMVAMERAFNNLMAIVDGLRIDRIAVDGNRCPKIPLPCEAIVHGDALIPEIQAASILAKTSRDAWMEWYARTEPRYGFSRHKGYPTAAHRAVIAEVGPCPIHRRSFRGVGSG